MNKPRVLVVDDNQDLRCLYSFALSLRGAEVEEAEDGEQALRLVKEQKPDVVLTDIQMPNMDGVELIKCIKTDTELSAMPVIALSACSKEHLYKASMAGATKILEKPVDPLALFDEVWEVLPAKDACTKKAA